MNVFLFQSQMNSIEAECSQLRDNNLHQRKRIMEMMVSLLKDLSEIGVIVGGHAAEIKV